MLRTRAQRLRPVLLTTITTVCGLLPMALQFNVDFPARTVHFGSVTSIWWVQLSTAIISGLSFATLLTLVLTPVWIAAPTVYGDMYRGWRARRQTGGETAPVQQNARAVKRKPGRKTKHPAGPRPVPDAAE